MCSAVEENFRLGVECLVACHARDGSEWAKNAKKTGLNHPEVVKTGDHSDAPQNREESDPLPPLCGVKWAHFKNGITAEVPFESAPTFSQLMDHCPTKSKVSSMYVALSP